MKKSHERLTLSEMAVTAAQIQMQALEDNEAGERRKYVDELSRAKARGKVLGLAWSCNLKSGYIIIIILYHTILYCIVLYCIVLYCIVLYCIVLYCIVLYCFVLYCIVLYTIVLHYSLKPLRST